MDDVSFALLRFELTVGGEDGCAVERRVRFRGAIGVVWQLFALQTLIIGGFVTRMRKWCVNKKVHSWSPKKRWFGR